ncbi:MAG: hypothetical protein RLZZ15_3348 [Verrucomicrobiota bacterium]
MNADAKTLLALATPICCAGVLVQSLEVLWNWRELPDGGLLAWTRATTPTANPLVRFARAAYQFPGAAIILAARAAVALACLVLPYGSASVCALLAALVVAQLYFNRRFTILRGNCDTLTLVCLSGAWAGSLPAASARLQAAALGFIAFHAGLAYVLTGYDKLKSPLWRDGTRLIQILRDGNYRFPPLADALGRHPRWMRAGAWGVIALELLFPLCVVLPPAGFWSVLAGGAVFHAAVAVTMGLHGFWWAFVASYPAFYFVHTSIAAWLAVNG